MAPSPHSGETQTIHGWLIYGAALNEGREMFKSNNLFHEWKVSCQLDTTERHKAYREQKKEARAPTARAADRPEKPNENSESRSCVQPKTAPATPEEEADEARTLMINAVILKVRRLTYRELLQLKVHLA